MPLRRSITVRVPATSANLGPGFDIIGMALNVFNDITLMTEFPNGNKVKNFSMTITGEGADTLAKDETNMVVKAVKLALEKAGYFTDKIAFHLHNRIPIGAGLGSSSAAIVGGLLAGFTLANYPVHVSQQETLLQMASTIEGHVDNLAACIYGGVQIGVHTGERWYTSAVQVPHGMQCILLIPNERQSTDGARAILPPMVSRADAVYNLGRVALLVNAFASGAWEDLALATEDKLHQPAREHIMPALAPVINAAKDAGAHAAFLSGAGSAIMAITSGRKGDIHGQYSGERRDRAIAMAMMVAATKVERSGRIVITHPTVQGAYVVSIDGDENAVFTGIGLEPKIAKSVQYISTRASPDTDLMNFESVLFSGLAPDGGLFIPTRIPHISMETIMSWKNLPYAEVAANVINEFVGYEIPMPDLVKMCKSAYSAELWSTPKVLPLKSVQLNNTETLFVAEQFHGPTCSFKDLALQLVGRMFSYFLQKRGRNITVLGATSGDTGSAAIAGLRGLQGVKVVILHPRGRVSKVQELQMTTTVDANVYNVAVEGASFDDCQTIVKTAFKDPEFRARHSLTAVNSINWGRILAQIPYYFWTYLRWQETTGDKGKMTVAVPTGNFGNALSAYYARRMGLPLTKVHVATNANDGLHKFISEGVQIMPTEVIPTLAPSMDIAKSSNFERWMNEFDCVEDNFTSSSCSDEDIVRTQEIINEESGYEVCPHTATAIHAINVVPEIFEAFVNRSLVVMATAHPAKFSKTVTVPPQLQGLETLPTAYTVLPNSADAIMAFVDRL